MPDDKRNVTASPSPDHAPQWARYRRLRRGFWKTCLAFLLLAVPYGLLFVLRPEKNSVLAFTLGLPTILWFLTCWIAAAYYWGNLLSFRCPRCRKRFVIDATGSFPGDACRHCGLPVRA